MKRVFRENPTAAFRRPSNLRDELVRFKLHKEGDKVKGMKRCHKSQCKICTFVETGREFEKIKNI